MVDDDGTNGFRKLFSSILNVLFLLDIIFTLLLRLLILKDCSILERRMKHNSAIVLLPKGCIMMIYYQRDGEDDGKYYFEMKPKDKRCDRTIFTFMTPFCRANASAHEWKYTAYFARYTMIRDASAKNIMRALLAVSSVRSSE